MKKMFFMLIKLISLTISVQVNAFEYDPLLMRAQASIFPKIILLDKDIASKVTGDKVIIEILHSSDDAVVADKVKTLIEKQYKHRLGNRKLLIKINDFSVFNESEVATAYIVLKGSPEFHSSITRHAADNNRLVFSYDYRDFSNNVLVSVLMKEKTYIYLNKSEIHRYGINFQPLFYKIVKVIE